MKCINCKKRMELKCFNDIEGDTFLYECWECAILLSPRLQILRDPQLDIKFIGDLKERSIEK